MSTKLMVRTFEVLKNGVPGFLPRWRNAHDTQLAHLFIPRQRETPAQVARRLSADLGVPSSARSATDLWRETSNVLQGIPLDLLIIDQAECLSPVVCTMSSWINPSARSCSLAHPRCSPRYTAILP